MSERVEYSAAGELNHLGRFLRRAARDFACAWPIGRRLFVADVQGRHRRMLLGYAWLAIPTLLMAGIWVFLQSTRLISVGWVGMPYPVYVFSGMLLWQLFLDALNAPVEQLRASTALVTRTAVPVEALLVAGVLNVALSALARLAVLAAMLVLFGIAIGPAMLLAPLALAALLAFGLAIGVLLAPVGLLYEDVPRATTMIAGMWFFLTPVVYRAPAGAFVQYNPVTPLVDFGRHWLTGGAGEPSASMTTFAAVALASIPLLAAGLVLLRLARPHLVARLG